MLRLLVVAPTCNGEDVGEAWVAHQWVTAAAERHRVTLLTYHKRGQRPAAEQLPGVRVVEWVEPPLLGRAERLNSMLKPGYVPFYGRARRWMTAALRRGERFDLAHQPTPVAMRYPSPLCGSGIPYILGPVGGSLEPPAGFPADDTAPWYVGLRALDRGRLRHDPLLRRSYASAECVVGIAPYVRDLLGDVPLKRFEVISDTGIAEVPARVRRSRGGAPLRLLFVGRLVRSKGARDAIGALKHLRDLDVVLDVVGEGYDRAACEALSSELALTDRVRFHRRVPRADVEAFYAAADVFVFPSYCEAGGTVVAEAMGHGLPMVVGNRGGPAAAVDDGSGIRVDPRSPEQYARDVAAAVRRLAQDGQLRLSMGEAARRRVQEVRSWTGMSRRMNELYEELARRA